MVHDDDNMAGQVHWLLGREGGIGLTELGDQLLLLTGQPGRPDSNGFTLHRSAVDSLWSLLGRFRESGRLLDSSTWPTTPWGSGDFPKL
jgi:hypothetical protein